MGKTKTSVKQSSPIPLPHDGLIHLFHRQRRNSASEGGEASELPPPFVKEASDLLLLLTAAAAANAQNELQQPRDEAESEEQYQIRHLVQSLQQAAGIKDQLHQLHTFKNWWLQHHRRRCRRHPNEKQETQPSTSLSFTTTTTTTTTSTATTDTDAGHYYYYHHCYYALYRLLLEWMWSVQTPVPLRRAVQSVLAIVWTVIPSSESSTVQVHGDDDVLDTIHRSVLRSMLAAMNPVAADDNHMIEENKDRHHQSGPSSSCCCCCCCWSQPMRSLHEFLSWEPLQTCLLDTAITGDSSLWVETVVCLQRVAKRVHAELVAVQQRQQEVTNTSKGGSSSYSSMGTIAVWDSAFLDQIQEALILVNLIKKTLGLYLSSPAAAATTTTTTTSSASLLPFEVCHTFQDFLGALLQCRAVPVDSLSIVSISYGRVLLFVPNRNNEQNVLSSAWNLASQLSELARAALLQGLSATVLLEQLMTKPKNGEVPVWERLLSSMEELVLQSSDPEVRLAALKGMRGLVSRYQTHRSMNLNMTDDEFDATSVINRVLEVVLHSWENPTTRKLANAILALFESLVGWMRELEKDDGESWFPGLIYRLLAQSPSRKGRYLALETLLPITGAQEMMNGAKGGLLNELLMGIGDHGHNTGAIADLWAKLLAKRLKEIIETESGNNGKKSKNGTQMSDGQRLPAIWLDAWIPSLAKALSSGRLSRRRQVSAFCLPRIIGVISDVSTRDLSGQAFAAVLLELQYLSQQVDTEKQEAAAENRIIWAEFEVARVATRQSWFRSSHSAPQELRTVLRDIFPLDRLRSALIHSSPFIRMTSLQSLGGLVDTYHPGTGKARTLKAVKNEMELWQFMLPFAAKDDGKEYTGSVLECLINFLDIQMVTEAKAFKSEGSRSDERLPLTYSFIANFLLGDMISFLGYPGTCARKSSFLFLIIECVVLFAARDLNLGLDFKQLPKIGAAFERRRCDVELATMAHVRLKLISKEVISALHSSLRTNWDGIRATAYRLFSAIVNLAQRESLQMPFIVTSDGSRGSLEAHGLILASSPRQREADTGSRLLAVLFHSLPSRDDKIVFLDRCLSLIDERLESMKKYLNAVLEVPHKEPTDSGLPLSHGFVHFLLLVVENDDLFSVDVDEDEKSVLDRMIGVFIHALQVSLSIIADVNEGDTVEGLDGDSLLPGAKKSCTSRVNPGAIGANGVFSSVTRVSEEEIRMRLSSQRLIVGTWLLMKETCAAITAIFMTKSYPLDRFLIEQTGMLLISTLTSLKHTGAAFAAHRSLQQIVQRCMHRDESSLHHVSAKWTARLLKEVAVVDRVRDSTLRRSTGYALGFLSIMRAEVLSRTKPCPLCRHILLHIIQLALPSKKRLYEILEQIGMTVDKEESRLFTFGSINAAEAIPSDPGYELRTRVHALNVLRLIILDAPLSDNIFPFIGDAILLSIIGYTDPEWAVRNSSTMVFAAVMLRSIDADKNATNSDITSRKATSAAELFRSYKRLPAFLLSVLRASTEGRILSDHHMSLPPVLPILQLFARIQPVRQSGSDDVSLVESFVDDIIRCLDNVELIVRTTAARALANISSRDNSSCTSMESLSNIYQSRLSTVYQAYEQKTRFDWNGLHGTLLSILELLRSSSDGKESVRKALAGHAFVTFTWVDDRISLLPPSCVSVLMDILSELYEGTESLQKAYLDVLTWVERSHITKANVPGATELGMRVAIIAVRSVNLVLWKDNTSKDKFDSAVALLSRMRSSPCPDVFISAIKAFKKDIYRGLDSIVEDYIGQQEKVATILSTTCTLISAALLSEIRIITDSSERHVRHHPPTMRRLSRCLLECLYASNQLRLMPQVIQSIRIELTKILHVGLMGWDCLGTDDPDSWTLLAGNFVELKSLLASVSGTDADKTVLSSLVKLISNPYCHWRLRHSAATSMRTSGLLSATSDIEMLSVWLGLMQDDDADVRCAASVAWKLSDLPPEMILSSFFSERVVSALEIALEKILALTTKLTLLSSSTEQGGFQEIFVAENPNTYVEDALLLQFALMATMRVQQAELSVSNRSRINQLVRCCQNFATFLIEKGDMLDRSFLLNETRRSEVFVPFHSLLIGCAVFLWCGHLDPSSDLLGDCRRLSEFSRDLHPRIQEALDVVSLATCNSVETKQKINQCCFLVRCNNT